MDAAMRGRFHWAARVSACVGPEKGDAELTIDKAGGYTFTYHGGMAYLIGLAAKASGKPLRPKDVQGVGEALQSLSKDREFLSVTPAGFSRVNVDYKAVRKPGQSFAFIGDTKFITVSSDTKTHRLVIRSAAITPKNAAQLTQIGYRPDVALTVKSDLPVIASNGAVQRAILFGHDAYRWQIDLTPRPAVCGQFAVSEDETDAQPSRDDRRSGAPGCSSKG